MQTLEAADIEFDVQTNSPELVRQEVVETAEQRLRNSTYGELRNVFCSYSGGILTLHGRVSSFYMKQLAQALLAGLDNVGDLNNRLEVVD
jgi:hypothetical protein